MTEARSVRAALQRWAVVGVVAAPIAFAAARAVRRGWFPIGDSALLYIRAADVGTRHHPWLGSWTSASLSVGTNMNNPGAMYDWLMAPFARLLPPGPGAAVGVAFINILCVIGIAVAARHVGGRRFEQWMLAAAAALTWTMGSELLFDIWQAHALLLPFLLFLVLLTGCALGTRRCIPWALVVATLLVQTHISYAYVLSLLTVAAALLNWWRGRQVPLRQRLQSIRRRPLLMGGSVTLALWLPTIGEQFLSAGQGNLSRLASSLGKGDISLGGGNALRASAGVFAWPDWWLRSGFSTTVTFTPLSQANGRTGIQLTGLPGLGIAVTVLAVAVVLLWVLSRGSGLAVSPAASAACLLSAALLVGSVLSLTILTVGPVGLAPHHVRWLWAGSVFAHFSVLLALSEHVSRRWPALNGLLDRLPLVIATVLAFATLPFHAAPEGPVADRAVEPNLSIVFGSLDSLRDHQPILYRTDNLRVFEPYSSAVMMRMQEMGIEFRVTDPGMVRQLGNGRRSDGNEAVEVFQLESVDAMRYDGPACRLAYTSLVTGDAAERAERAANWASEALRSGDIAPLDSADLVPADAAMLAAAASGDDEAVTDLVYRKGLSRLLADGSLEVFGGDAQQLLDDMRIVDQWIATTYGLYATLPAPCPHG